MEYSKAKTLSILERKDINPEKIRWKSETSRSGRPFEISFDRKNSEFEKLAVLLEDYDGYFEGTEFKYWLFPNKKVIGRRRYTW